MRWGSVKVWKSSSAVVRNSSDAVTVVVLTATLLVEVVVVVLGAEVSLAALWGWNAGFGKPLEGFTPGAC
jgi:hypothetical protein